MRRCARITRSLQWVGFEVSDIPTYEGLPNLAYFTVEFEGKFMETQRFSSLDFALKPTPTIWWVALKESVSEWTQYRRLMEIRFGE